MTLTNNYDEPRVLPASWQLDARDADGFPRYVRRTPKGKLASIVICSVRLELDGKRWLHMSMSMPGRVPSYDELKEAKDLFIGVERMAVQVFPRAKDHYSAHPYCLHLWSCLDGDPTPDFLAVSGHI